LRPHSNVKAVGQGVAEYRIDFGPGYRIYIGQDGDVLITLLGGGTKKGQNVLALPSSRKCHKTRFRSC